MEGRKDDQGKLDFFELPMKGEERLNHLLACMTEEAGEVSQLVGKCQRFGIHDYHEKTGNIQNIELLKREYNEVVAVAELLGIEIERDLVESKKHRIAKYMRYVQEKRRNDNENRI